MNSTSLPSIKLKLFLTNWRPNTSLTALSKEQMTRYWMEHRSSHWPHLINFLHILLQACVIPTYSWTQVLMGLRTSARVTFRKELGWLNFFFTFKLGSKVFHCRGQSTLRPPEVHILTIHFNVNAWFAWRLWELMIYMPCTWGRK